MPSLSFSTSSKSLIFADFEEIFLLEGFLKSLTRFSVWRTDNFLSIIFFAITKQFTMSEFRKLAQLTLDDVFNLVESKYDDFEVDFEEENLHIESSSKNLIFVI